MRAGHPGCDFKYLLKSLSNLISSLSRPLTVQICSCLCPHPFISQSVSLSIQVSFCYQIHQPFSPHIPQLSLIQPVFVFSDVLSFFHFFAFHTRSLRASLSLCPSLLCPLFLFPLSSVLCLSRSSPLISLPSFFLLPLCPLLSSFPPTSPPLLLFRLVLPYFPSSEMYYCHLVFKTWTTAAPSLISGTGKACSSSPPYRRLKTVKFPSQSQIFEECFFMLFVLGESLIQGGHAAESY